MPRTFRTNYEKAAGIEPDRCEICRELLAQRHLYAWYSPTSAGAYDVCFDCLPKVVAQLQQRDIPFRVDQLENL